MDKQSKIAPFLSAFWSLLFLVALVGSQSLYAHRTEVSEFSANNQSEQVLAKGIVTDTNGVPLPGVAVIVKNSQQGTSTSIDGAFSLYLPSNEAVLQFSFIGYAVVEVAAPFGKTMHIKLHEDSKQVEEVVVVGYGVQKKMTVTGAVTTAKVDRKSVV